MYKVLFVQRKAFDLATLDLEKQIKSYESNGWIPQGGVSITQDGNSSFYIVAQAMVKKDE